MNREKNDEGISDDVDIGDDVAVAADFEPEETIVIEATADSDNVGDLSVEINVEELVAKVEVDDPQESEKKRVVRKRLEDLEEEIGDNLDSTYNFNLDEDI